jgi:mutator protein MutT
MAKFLIYCAVYVFLRRDGKVYLTRRAGTGYRDGMYSLPAGHVEEGETLTEAMMRELREETGLSVPAAHLKLAHAMYRRCDDRTYADYYYVCDAWNGEPQITEPDKCDAAMWVDENALPPEAIPEVRHALACILKGEPFSDVHVPVNTPGEFKAEQILYPNL